MITYSIYYGFFWWKKIYKYFIGYNDEDDYKIKTLCMMLPKTKKVVLVKQNGSIFCLKMLLCWKSFLIFELTSVILKSNLKTRIRSYGDEAIGFQSKKMPEAGSNYIFWPVTLIDSVFEKEKNYYLHVFLKECEYNEKDDWIYYWWLKMFFWWFWPVGWRRNKN